MIVDIDEQAIAAELDARLASLPEDALTGEFIQGGSQEWHKLLRELHLIDALHEGVAPSWQIDAGRKEDLIDATGDALEKLWPGGISGADSWGPWARIVYISTMIAIANFDFEHMRFKPLRPAPPPEDKKPDPEKPNGSD